MSSSEQLALAVKSTKGSIESNLEQLSEHVDAVLAEYSDWNPDPSDEQAVKDAKSERTYLNGLKKRINEERLAVKREYLKPLDSFEKRVKEVTGRIDEVTGRLKDCIDGAEEARKADKRLQLEKHYEEFAPALVPVVPYERFHEERWLNKTCTECFEELEDKLEQAARDHAALMAMEGLYKPDETEAEFFRCLDLGAAIKWSQERRAEDERIEELHRSMSASARRPEPEPEPENCLEPEPEPQPEPRPAAPAISDEQRQSTLQGFYAETVPAREEGRASVIVIVAEVTEAQKAAMLKWFGGNGVHGRVLGASAASRKQVEEAVKGCLAKIRR